MLLTSTQEIQQPSKPMRLQSADTLRGITMFLVMGAANTILHLKELSGNAVFTWISDQMPHAAWNGLTIGDLFFPTLIFVAGIVFPFSLENRMKKCGSKSKFYLHIFKRAIMLILFGMVYNGLLQNFWHVRYASVPGRIGIAWMIAALIYINTKRNRTRIIWVGAIFIGYWLLLRFVPAPDFPGAELYSAEGSFACYVDRLLIPEAHRYTTMYDPEGILSSFTAGAECLIGMIIGNFVKSENENISQSKKCVYMGVCGASLIVLGCVWNIVFPINKKMFTSTFACVSAGIAMILFALLHYIIDVCGYNKWDKFFRIVGYNTLAIFIGRQVVDFHEVSNFFFGSIISLFPSNWTTFLTKAGAVVICWIILNFLYKKKIYLKI